MKFWIAVIPVAVAATIVGAAEQRVELKAGAGREKVEANCVACHSLDYIVANSPFLTRQVWDAEVTKMIKAFGAPISDADAKEIVDYLSANYGAP
jgi:mono/diheme cytochrome c family protein